MPEFIDADGIAIVYDVHPAQATPRGVVQLCHGYGEHAGRYARPDRRPDGRGLTVYADDHRGHGRTGIAAARRRSVSSSASSDRAGVPAAVDALWQFTGIIRDENPELPLVLLGHSWGSFMAQMLLNRHPDAYDLVVLSGTVYRQLGSGNLGDLNERWNAPDANGHGVAVDR